MQTLWERSLDNELITASKIRVPRAPRSAEGWHLLPAARIERGTVCMGSSLTFAPHLVGLLLSLAIILMGGRSSGADKPSVVYVGDSITVLATPAIHTLLDPNYNVDVLALYGIRIEQALPALQSALKSRPYAVVENLGTNDALQGRSHHDWVSSWDKLVRITRTTPCVVFTTINPAADTYSHRPIATRINADIRALAATDPEKYKVADWSRFLSRNLRNRRTYLRAEPILIHPTPAGAVKLATLDQDALAKCGSRTS
jgi:GDSL-like Lipase/Acylhydrolase family